MTHTIIQDLLHGSPEERDTAARQICQSRMKNLIDELIDELPAAEARVRETIVIILGVLDQQKSLDVLQSLSKSDPETNVRIAAILSRENAGRMTYDRLKAEVRRFQLKKGETPYEETPAHAPRADESGRAATRLPEIKPVAEKKQRTDVSAEGEKRKFSTFSKKIILVAGVLAGVALLGYYLHFGGREEIQPAQGEHPSGEIEAVAAMIRERIAAIEKFKTTSLNPENPASRYPMTLEIRTIPGETYGELFEKVYENILGTEAGINTLGAFWRHVNFGSTKTQNVHDLMKRETSDELLLFPNPAAVSVELKVESGTMAYQSLNNLDPDLDILIKVDHVVVR